MNERKILPVSFPFLEMNIFPRFQSLSVLFSMRITASLQCAAVSDSPYPKEAFSIGEEKEGENTVEVEDMDECLIYEGSICDHRCVNTPGSFRCECFPGYVLQEDASTCAQGSVKTTKVVFLSHSASTHFHSWCLSTGKRISLCDLLFDIRFMVEGLSGRAHLI